MPKLYLTDTFVENIFCVSGKEQELFWDDPQTPNGKLRKGSVEGVGLKVTATGKKAFIHSFTIKNTRRRIVIGKARDMSVATARMKVKSRSVDILNGKDPDRGTEQAMEDRPKTIKELALQFWEENYQDKTELHRYDYVRYIMPGLEVRPPSATKRGWNKKTKHQQFSISCRQVLAHKVKPGDVKKFLDQFESPSTYNRALAFVRAFFNWAIQMQLVDMRNPCSPFKKKKILRRKREYTIEDIRTITRYIYSPTLQSLPALTTEGLARRDQALVRSKVAVSNRAMTEFCHFMGILFLTTARPVELRHAKFEHFDLERLIWHKHETKGIKLSKADYEYTYRSIPIHPMVAYLVREQRKLRVASQYVFPSAVDDDKPRDNFRKPLAQFKKLPGIPVHFQVYDLKRIALSFALHNTKLDRNLVSHFTDHKGDTTTTMIYDLGIIDIMRPVADEIGNALEVSSVNIS